MLPLQAQVCHLRVVVERQSVLMFIAGVLKAGIVPATVCPFVDINNNAQLNRFGLHNGGEQNRALLNEKWEGLALVPVDPSDCDDKQEYFLFASADNDFITQNGMIPP